MPYELFLALRYLLAKRKQTFLSLISFISVLGITVGVTALIIALSLATGFQEDIRGKILGANAHITVFAGSSNLNDVESVRQAVEEVEGVLASAPIILEKGLIVSDLNPQGYAAVVRGIDPELQAAVTDLQVDLERAQADSVGSGLLVTLDRLRPAQPAGDAGGPRSATLFLGVDLADNLRVVVGDSVRLIIPQVRLSPFSVQPKSVRYEVAGLADSGFYDFDISRVYMHIQEAQRLYGLGDQVNAVQVRVESVLELDRMRRAVQEKLGEGYWATDLLRQNRSFFSALRLEKLIAFLVIGLIILVAALNIISTLILMVMEKVRDIGTLVSMGATSRSVMSLFMLQGTLIGIAGTTLGCALGISFSWAMDRYQLIPMDPDVYFISHLPFKLRPLEFVLTAVVSLGISFLATLYPAWRASRLDPVEALQHE
ncbi:MAG: FtsX-like permease family protein [Acidobacteria bacterium]|nr:MAG: FtsX-like permease family protein [Acidobacteriota bacterium]